MRLDIFKNPIFNETDVFEFLYQGNTSVLSELHVDINQELRNLESIADIQFKDIFAGHSSIDEFDKNNHKLWFMSDNYKNFDIEEWIIGKCNTSEQHNRIICELAEFNRLDMVNLLRWCKYFVDVCTAHDIMWGVGRGSSVSSYALYLIGVHRIDSIRYNLDWKEFLR